MRVLEQHYPPTLAQDWDKVGLVCGDPQNQITKILLTVDVTAKVVEEAEEIGAQLIVAHHPFLLRGVNTIATTTPKGRLLHRLIKADIALYTAHTNADSARAGVNEALAKRLGLRELAPLSAAPTALDRLVVFVPHKQRDAVVDAVDAVIGPVLGDYTRCAFWADGTGTFTPGAGANPTIGEIGRVSVVPESRLEMVIPRNKRARAVRAMLDVHPYEEPAYDVIELAHTSRDEGLGRIGLLTKPLPFAEFVRAVAGALPSTVVGVRGSGDPQRLISRVAVCGGAGDSLLADATRAGVDAYVTADLRHHPASDVLEADGPALVDAGHWATEWTWLPVAAELLDEEFGPEVGTTVSEIVTDPWTVRI
ncbi:MAG: Nif3-like dinuclear metal center hexameric protein [Corynebacteriales bacterium]|nr:Nif3-like dinuclear metal center hexameric protein [Mycobacteriales bacterium]